MGWGGGGSDLHDAVCGPGRGGWLLALRPATVQGRNGVHTHRQLCSQQPRIIKIGEISTFSQCDDQGTARFSFNM